MFYATREDELVQLAHRVRPGQADPGDEKWIDLLTNVPTDLPIDEFVRLEELADPLQALLPVPDGAIDLYRAIRDVAEGDGPPGFREWTIIDVADDGTVSYNVRKLTDLARKCGVTARGKDEAPDRTTISRWVNDLERIGLHVDQGYEQRSGVVYSVDIATLASALKVLSSSGFAKVASVRALKAKLRESAGSIDWLEWAERVFDISGDRSEWGPPPDPA